MKKSRKNSPTNIESLFLDETILEHPFACIKRMELLSQIKEAVQHGVNLILLTGEQGSGKTMLCRLLQDELASSYTTLFFSQAVDSFDDVVRSVAVQLGVEGEAGDEDADIDFAVEQISDFLLDESKGLLIIFDEAENIFLATLEGIRRMLEQMIGSGVRIHILLSGRKTLLENCDQISIGDFPNINQQQFDLAPLSYDETADYLRNVAVWQSDIDVSTRLDDSVVREIYDSAQGNLALTNTFARDALKAPDEETSLPDEDTSFMVLLAGVKEGVDSIGDHPVFMRYTGLVKKLSQYLPWAGVAACCLLLLFFLFGYGENEKGLDQEPNRAVEVETATVVDNAETLLSDKDQLEKAESATTEPPYTEKETAGQEEEQEKATEEAEMAGASLPPSLEQSDGQVTGVVEQSGVATETGGIIDETAAMVEDEPAQELMENEIVDAEGQKGIEAGLTKEEGDVVRLRRLDKVKKKSDLSPNSQKIDGQLSQTGTGRGESPTASTKADLLFTARLHAGSGWFSGAKDGMYTVQLMALTSKDAEKNLKKMLSTVAYRQESGNFYILKKVTIPEGILVFYGEYPSLERARLAQDSLPRFLRDHKPYVLSIAGAVAKVTR